MMKTIEDIRNSFLKEPWNTFHGKAWKRVAKIGKGSFGAVYIGQRVEDGMVFAVKSTELLFKPQSKSVPIENLKALQNEIMTLSELRCKHVIRMLGCGRSDGKNSFQADEKSMLDLFLEYIPRGSLHHLMTRLQMGATTATTDLGHRFAKKAVMDFPGVRRVKRLPEDYVRAYTADILRGVDYLHRKQFVHGDIKPLNLLVAEDCLKLADFGGCKTLKQKRADSWQIHTGSYTAPEVYYKVEQGLASDIFSVGCTVLEMTTGFIPEPLFIPQWLSKDGQNFLRRCLTSDPYKRWTAAQLLEHPFIRDRDQNDTGPYSTLIPPEAERMILQPPPIEFYTNTMLSPTYRGDRSPLGPTDPKILHQRIYDNSERFRKEKITISSASPPPPPSTQKDGSDEDETFLSIHLVASERLAAKSSPTPVHPVQVRAGAPLSTSTDSGSSTSNPWVEPPAKKHAPKGGHPAPHHIKDAILVLPDYKPEFEPPEDRSLHFLLPGAPPREEKEANDLEAGATAILKETPRKMKQRPPPLVIPDQSPDSKGEGFSGPEKQHKYVTLIPSQISNLSHQELTDYKSEGFSGPEKQHKYVTLIPSQISNLSHQELTDYKSEGFSGPEKQHKYVTLIPSQISNLSQQELKQLKENLPNLEEYNEEIREEARVAEEAGIYHNKLCPGANDEESSTSWKSPPRNFSNKSTFSDGYKSFMTMLVNCLMGNLNCKKVDSPQSHSSSKS